MSKTQTKPKVAPKKPEADKPKAEPTKKVTKKQQMIDMLKRPDGATDTEMVKSFNWKGKHVARGQRSSLGKEYRDKNAGLMICKFTRTPSGDTAYKIEPIEEQKPKAA